MECNGFPAIFCLEAIWKLHHDRFVEGALVTSEVQNCIFRLSHRILTTKHCTPAIKMLIIFGHFENFWWKVRRGAIGKICVLHNLLLICCQVGETILPAIRLFSFLDAISLLRCFHSYMWRNTCLNLSSKTSLSQNAIYWPKVRVVLSGFHRVDMKSCQCVMGRNASPLNIMIKSTDSVSGSEWQFQNQIGDCYHNSELSELVRYLLVFYLQCWIFTCFSHCKVQTHDKMNIISDQPEGFQQKDDIWGSHWMFLKL